MSRGRARDAQRISEGARPRFHQAHLARKDHVRMRHTHPVVVAVVLAWSALAQAQSEQDLATRREADHAGERPERSGEARRSGGPRQARGRHQGDPVATAVPRERAGGARSSRTRLRQRQAVRGRGPGRPQAQEPRQAPPRLQGTRGEAKQARGAADRQAPDSGARGRPRDRGGRRPRRAASRQALRDLAGEDGGRGHGARVPALQVRPRRARGGQAQGRCQVPAGAQGGGMRRRPGARGRRLRRRVSDRQGPRTGRRRHVLLAGAVVERGHGLVHRRAEMLGGAHRTRRRVRATAARGRPYPATSSATSSATSASGSCAPLAERGRLVVDAGWCGSRQRGHRSGDRADGVIDAEQRRERVPHAQGLLDAGDERIAARRSPWGTSPRRPSSSAERW